MDGFLEKCKEKVHLVSAPCLNGKCRIWTGTRSKKNYCVLCYMHAVKENWVTVHVFRLSAMLHHATSWISWLEASIDASQLCHNMLCCSKAHYSETTWYKQLATNRSLSQSALQTWSNDWHELRIQKSKLIIFIKCYTGYILYQWEVMHLFSQ